MGCEGGTALAVSAVSPRALCRQERLCPDPLRAQLLLKPQAAAGRGSTSRQHGHGTAPLRVLGRLLGRFKDL